MPGKGKVDRKRPKSLHTTTPKKKEGGHESKQVYRRNSITEEWGASKERISNAEAGIVTPDDVIKLKGWVADVKELLMESSAVKAKHDKPPSRQKAEKPNAGKGNSRKNRKRMIWTVSQEIRWPSIYSCLEGQQYAQSSKRRPLSTEDAVTMTSESLTRDATSAVGSVRT